MVRSKKLETLSLPAKGLEGFQGWQKRTDPCPNWLRENLCRDHGSDCLDVGKAEERLEVTLLDSFAGSVTGYRTGPQTSHRESRLAAESRIQNRRYFRKPQAEAVEKSSGYSDHYSGIPIGPAFT